MAPRTYQNLDFTDTFLESLADGKEFRQSERKSLLSALRALDQNEKQPSLRVHQLSRELLGIWSASASDNLRMTFIRSPNGRKVMLTCSHQYA